MTRVLLAVFLLTAIEASAADFRELSIRIEGGGEGRPLVLALHPGGARMRYYGSAYAKLVVTRPIVRRRRGPTRPPIARSWRCSSR